MDRRKFIQSLAAVGAVAVSPKAEVIPPRKPPCPRCGTELVGGDVLAGGVVTKTMCPECRWVEGMVGDPEWITDPILDVVHSDDCVTPRYLDITRDWRFIPRDKLIRPNNCCVWNVADFYRAYRGMMKYPTIMHRVTDDIIQMANGWSFAPLSMRNLKQGAILQDTGNWIMAKTLGTIPKEAYVRIDIDGVPLNTTWRRGHIDILVPQPKNRIRAWYDYRYAYSEFEATFSNMHSVHFPLSITVRSALMQAYLNSLGVPT